MNYDDYVLKKCGVLTPAQQLRTGFKTQGDIRKATALIKNPLNRSAYGRAGIVDRSASEIQNIILTKANVKQDLRVNKLIGDANIPVRPAPVIGFANDTDSDASSVYGVSSLGSYVPSTVSARSSIEEAVNQQIDLYEGGLITKEELMEGIDMLGATPDLTEVLGEQTPLTAPSPARGGAREGAGRPSRSEQDIRFMTGQSAGEQRREAGEAVDDLLEEAIGDIEAEVEAPSYTPPPRRDLNRGRFEDDNRGAGQGQVNPNAPSYAAGGYSRRTEREAYDPRRP